MCRIVLLLAGCLLAVGSAVGGTDRLPAGAVLVDEMAQSAQVDAIVAEAKRGLRSGDAIGVASRLVAIDDALTREAAAARVLDRFQASGTDAPAALLEAFETMPVQVWRRHDETAADWFVPVYDIPAKARSQRMLQERARAVATLAAAMHGKRADTMLAQLADADPQIAALAVDAVPIDALEHLGSSAKAAGAPLSSPVLAAVARRTRAPVDMLLAIDAGAPLDVLPLFESTLPALAPDDALQVLRVAITHPEYTSTATFALAALAQRDAAVAATFSEWLAAPATGASAAAALARSPDALAQIDAVLAAQPSARTLANLALALRLEGSAAALQRLDRLRDDPRVPAHVRAELQR